jgi:hypothetical protein
VSFQIFSLPQVFQLSAMYNNLDTDSVILQLTK